MSDTIPNGTPRDIDGKPYVYYDGYWIKHYDPPHDKLRAKKQLIQALTHRLFNHVEHGINMPGNRLNEARRAYDAESDPERKRVKGAMLAGALFNRSADIFTKLVELQELGVEVGEEDSLMRECGRCFLEALDFGKTVRHRNGDECIDELWGEPVKAFSMPVEAFYESRYIKIAQTMHEIDRISEAMVGAFVNSKLFAGVDTLVRDFAEAAKLKCETLRTDPAIFDVWPSFVVAGEKLSHAAPDFSDSATDAMRREGQDGVRLIAEGKRLLTHITRARVPMSKSTQQFIDLCRRYRFGRSEKEV